MLILPSSPRLAPIGDRDGPSWGAARRRPAAVCRRGNGLGPGGWSVNHRKTIGKPWENGDFMGFSVILWDLPSGKTRITMEHGHGNSEEPFQHGDVS